MQKKTKNLIIKTLKVFVFFAFIFLVVKINILKFKDGTLSNFERITDVGISDANRSLQRPVLVALFYEDVRPVLSDFYFTPPRPNDFETSRVRIAVVPQNINQLKTSVASNLYEKIPNINTVKEVSLVYESSEDAEKHSEILNESFPEAEIAYVSVNKDSDLNYSEINAFLEKPDSLIVFLTDLDYKLDKNSFINDIIAIAKSHNYKVKLFDIADYYAPDFEQTNKINNDTETADISLQKKNLERFVEQYRSDILYYFIQNADLSSKNKELEIPSKTEDNYRLFDRGTIYVKVLNKDNVQIFEELKLDQAEGLIVSLADISSHIVNSNQGNNGKYFYLYFLTDMEQINIDGNKPLSSVLEADDGIYVFYENKAGLLLADERPDTPEDLISKLRLIAQIGDEISNDAISFYRFKYTELKYEN